MVAAQALIGTAVVCKGQGGNAGKGRINSSRGGSEGSGSGRF